MFNVNLHATAIAVGPTTHHQFLYRSIYHGYHFLGVYCLVLTY